MNREEDDRKNFGEGIAEQAERARENGSERALTDDIHKDYPKNASDVIDDPGLMIERIIKHLTEPGPYQIEKLAERLNIDEEILSGYLEELIGMGFIERIPLEQVEQMCEIGMCSLCGGHCGNPPPRYDRGVRDSKYHYNLTIAGWGVIGKTGPVDVI